MDTVFQKDFRVLHHLIQNFNTVKSFETVFVCVVKPFIELQNEKRLGNTFSQYKLLFVILVHVSDQCLKESRSLTFVPEVKINPRFFPFISSKKNLQFFSHPFESNFI